MLRYRGAVAASMVMAVVSGGGLTLGLVAVLPVLKIILGEGQGGAGPKDLPQLVADLNTRPWLNGRIPQEWIDALPTGPFNAVIVIVGGLGVLTIIGAAANFLHEYLSLTVVQRTVTNLRREAFHRVLRLPLRDVVARGTADAVSRVVNDSTALGAGLAALLARAVSQVGRGVGALVAALVIDWRLTLIACVVAPVMYVVIRKLSKRIRRASRSALESQGGLYGAALEALQGLRVVKVHTTERYEAGRFHRLNKQFFRQMLRARTARALSSPVTEVLALFVLGGMSVVAAKAILDGQLEPSRFMLVMGALFTMAAALKPLTGIVNDITAASAAAQRLLELMARAPEPGHDATLPRLPRHVASIEFRSVSMVYPGAQRPALRDVSLVIRHGERVAVVGPNGSGKTTLLSLVPRLFDPDSGAVLIDSRDIRSVSIRSLRRQIGVVTQETVLFRGTIRSNIAYGAEGVTEERLVAAAVKARAHEFIVHLPNGYDTPVGEQGLTLSGGQRQRLAIARAVLRDPAILILDEATSMIDADSEAKIAEAVADFSAGRTCLIVAHRLSTVLGADRIVVMDEGRLIDQGSHADLLARCEAYQRIARGQLVQHEHAG